MYLDTNRSSQNLFTRQLFPVPPDPTVKIFILATGAAVGMPPFFTLRDMSAWYIGPQIFKP